MQEGIARLDLQRLMQATIASTMETQGVVHSVAVAWVIVSVKQDGRPGYESVSPQAGAAILEISVLSFQFREVARPDGGKVHYQLSMTSRARLLAPDTRNVLDELTGHYKVSRIPPRSGWATRRGYSRPRSDRRRTRQHSSWSRTCSCSITRNESGRQDCRKNARCLTMCRDR